MKKAKLSLDKDKLKKFFILHSEKIVCGLFVGLLVMMCWKAYGLEMFKQKPDDLAKMVADANQRIAESKFDSKQENVLVLDYPAGVNQRRGTISSEKFHTVAWCPPVYLYKVRRAEPTFLPLEELIADTGYGAIAEGGDGTVEAADTNSAMPARGVQVPANSRILGKHWAVIRGLVPVARQDAEYERVFSNAMHRDSKKDSPEWVEAGFTVQRAEVTSAGPVAEKDWVTLDLDAIVRDTLRKWATTFPEIADPALVEPTVCEPLPPLVGKNFDPETVIHLPQIGMAVKKAGGEEEKKVEVEADPNEKKGFFIKRGQAKGNANPNVANLMDDGKKKKVVPYRLFRFFDFSVEPGKIYRYRVRLALHNPNFGIDPRFLVVPKNNEKSVGDGEDRQTPWCEASNPVTLPRNYEIVAGPVYKPRSETKEVQATLMIRQWDSDQAVDAVHEFNKDGVRVPNEVKPEIVRGTMLNVKTPVMVIRPGSSNPVNEDIAFHTDELLVDMSGAEFMPGPTGPGAANARKLKTPTEMLFWQSNGELLIRDLVSDADDYERLKNQVANVPVLPGKKDPGGKTPEKKGPSIFDIQKK